MNPWIETTGVIALAVASFGLGRWFSLRQSGWYWGYAVPLLLVFLIAVPSWMPSLFFVAPFHWVVAGRTEFALMNLIVPCLLLSPLTRLPRRATGRWLIAFALVVVVAYGIVPFLSPALIRGRMESLKTHVDDDGVCRQSTEFNCGPAAAVTALRHLGQPAEEGEIAVAAHTSVYWGTPPDVLAEALDHIYRERGLTIRFRAFASIDELPRKGVVLAVVRYGFLVDHYVTVLEMTPTEVVVGDPLEGRVTLTRKEFTDKWRRQGITFNR